MKGEKGKLTEPAKGFREIREKAIFGLDWPREKKDLALEMRKLVLLPLDCGLPHSFARQIHEVGGREVQGD